MNKTRCTYDSPILIGANILSGSKYNLYNYMYNINPGLFGKENIKYLMMDTDSIMMKIDNCSYDKYLKILKDNSQYFSSDLGKMDNEINENIQEVISLASKCYSIKLKNDQKKKVKGIPKNYSKRFHNHEIFKNALYNKPDLNKKVEFYSINLKNGNLRTEKVIKDNISNFNDKKFMVDNLTSQPHEIYC